MGEAPLVGFGSHPIQVTQQWELSLETRPLRHAYCVDALRRNTRRAGLESVVGNFQSPNTQTPATSSRFLQHLLHHDASCGR